MNVDYMLIICIFYVYVNYMLLFISRSSKPILMLVGGFKHFLFSTIYGINIWDIMG